MGRTASLTRLSRLIYLSCYYDVGGLNYQESELFYNIVNNDKAKLKNQPDKPADLQN